MLKHRAANRKKRLSALPNVSPYIYDVKISGLTSSSIYIYDISGIRVNGSQPGCAIFSVNIPNAQSLPHKLIRFVPLVKKTLQTPIPVPSRPQFPSGTIISNICFAVFPVRREIYDCNIVLTQTKRNKAEVPRFLNQWN
jgi:hypothetical protein